jgi:hypothetical protein
MNLIGARISILNSFRSGSLVRGGNSRNRNERTYAKGKRSGTKKGSSMKFRSLLVASVALFALIGCATPQINVNGAPATNGMLMLKNHETGIVAYAVAIRHYDMKQGDEVLKLHEYVRFGEDVTLNDETRSLAIALRIVNERKFKYSIVEVYKTYYYDETYPYLSEHTLYSGQLSYKEMVSHCPIPQDGSFESCNYWIEIRDRNGEPMFMIGDLRYGHGKKGGDEQLR